MKITTRLVKCEMCDAVKPDKSEFRAPHRHKMITLSIPKDDIDKRLYLDFCTVECLIKWANKSITEAS